MRLTLNCISIAAPKALLARSLAPLLLALSFSLSPAPPLAAVESARGPIQDNSFLLEEAYNQEAGVMQTIQTVTRGFHGSPASYALSQEFPLGGQASQLSYAVPISRNGRGETGLGDLAANYRYQLVGDGTTRVAFAPRVSLLVPTGNADRQLGTGAWGAQVNLPLSVVLAPSLVAHTNLGGTLLDGPSSGPGRSFFAGQSLVWLAAPGMNLLVEGTLTRGFGGPDGAPRTDLTVAPGVRFALDLPGELQVVPGAAITVAFGPDGSRSTGVFLYLSVEHPMRALVPGR